MDNFDTDKPIPLDDIDTGRKAVSHSPLDLGGSRPVEVQKEQKPQLGAPQVKSSVPQAVSAATQVVSSGRITAVKTFFTKLHAGALDFLDEQIADWLKKNPEINIKHIQTAVGEIQGKKTEPNIIITLWY